MVEIARIRNGLIQYANTHLMPKLAGKEQFLAGMALGLFKQNGDKLLAAWMDKPVMHALGVYENGLVNAESLYDTAMEQIRQQGSVSMELPVIGRVTFSEGDLCDLYQSIMGVSA